LGDKVHRKRPFGVIVLVVLQLLLVVSQVLGVAWSPSQMGGLLLLGKTTSGLLFGSALIGILVTLVITAGLWFLKRWAWFLVMLQLGVRMVILLRLYYAGQPQYVEMLISVLTVFYLNEREVQRAFEQAPAAEEGSWTT
jgi:hypothetical protein